MPTLQSSSELTAAVPGQAPATKPAQTPPTGSGATVARVASARPGKERFVPLLAFCAGMLLMLGAGMVYWFEASAAKAAAARAAAEERAMADVRAARAVEQAREREAQARAAQERLAAEEAAERARRAELAADAQAEALARTEREELARRRQEAEVAQRAANQTEEAWKRFYTPSPACREPDRAATVECVNEYVRAKREFQVRMATRSG